MKIVNLANLFCLFEGKRRMDEFNLIWEQMYVDVKEQNISTSIVQFALKRRIEYHVANTFLQVKFDQKSNFSF